MRTGMTAATIGAILDKESTHAYCLLTYRRNALFSATLVVLPGTAAAGGAFFIKGGVMRLQDDGQVIDTLRATWMTPVTKP